MGVKNGGWTEVLKPVGKGLACGDTGVGAMRDWIDIVHVIEVRFGLKRADLVCSKIVLSSSQDITSAYHNNIFKSIARVRVRELTKGLRVIPSYKSIVRWSHSKD